MKKILFTSRSIYNFNGAEKSMVAIMEFLRNENKISFLSPENIDTPLLKKIKEKKFPIFFNSFILSKKNIFKTLYIAFKIYKFIKKEKFEIVYLNRSDTLLSFGFIAFFMHLFSNIKIIVHLREEFPLNRLQKFFLNFTNIILVNTNHMGTTIIPKKHFFKTKILKPFIKIKKEEEKNSPPKSNKKILQLCTIGRISSFKGQKHIINALIYGLKNKKINVQFHLNIYGEPESDKHKEYYNEIMKIIKNNNLTNNITFWGYVENIQEHLKNQDIMFFLTSKEESAGRVFIEASTYNIPYIATDLPQLKEFTLGGLGGFWVNRDNYNEIIINFNKLCDKNIYKAKQQECKKLFSISTNQEKYKQEINKAFFCE